MTWNDKEGFGNPLLATAFVHFVVPPIWGCQGGTIKKDPSAFNLIIVLFLKIINLQFVILSHRVKFGKLSFLFHSLILCVYLD